jgi:type VI secretion system secreted protein VgrG
VHAEKDLTVDVENNATWRIGLKEDSNEIGKGEAKVTVNKTAEVVIDESLDVKVTKKFVKVDAGEEITLVTGQSKIVMKKDGTITIECKDLQVKAMNAIEMEGKVKFSAKAAQVAIEGQAQVNVKSSAMTKVEGAAMLDLSAGGIASLKGALTKIG